MITKTKIVSGPSVILAENLLRAAEFEHDDVQHCTFSSLINPFSKRFKTEVKSLSAATLTPNRPFPSSPKSLLQSESKCEIFVMVIRSNFNMNEN